MATGIAVSVIIAALCLTVIQFLNSKKSAPEFSGENQNLIPPQIIPTEIITPQSEKTVRPGCKISGCNMEICQNEDAEDLVSICIAKPEFACYKNAVCEIQPDGNCAWTQTEKLINCLNENQ